MVFLFFNTNIIQNINSFGEFIFDNYLPDDKFMRLAKIWIKNVFRVRRSAPEAIKKSKNKKRVYYSHPMVLYGTSIEKNALKLVRSKFDNVKIINPSDFPDCEMNDYCDIVKKCHILVAHPLSKNVLSAGVVKEIKTALKHEIPQNY